MKNFNVLKLIFVLLVGLVLSGGYVVAQDAPVQDIPAEVVPEAVLPAEAVDVATPPVAENDGVVAQDPAQIDGAIEGEVALDEAPALVVAAINPNEIPSLVFTYWEYNAIQEAKSSRGNIASEESAEEQDFSMPEDNAAKPPPEKRDIKLGGILYKTEKDWTIWLNGQRITPGAIPKEVIDLKVYEQYIEVKWYDRYTKQILPIRLRPHQRFNIDSRIFLPG